MRIVVDTNIIFSALLRKENHYANLLIKNEEEHTFYGVYFTFVELFKHKERIAKYSKLPEDTLLEVLYELLKRIHIVNDDLISNQSWRQAIQLAHDVDIKDVPNIALTIELEGKLWTSDTALKNGVRAKGFNDFFEP